MRSRHLQLMYCSTNEVNMIPMVQWVSHQSMILLLEVWLMPSLSIKALMLSVGQSKTLHWSRRWDMAILAHAIKCHDKCVMEVEQHIVLLMNHICEGREIYTMWRIQIFVG